MYRVSKLIKIHRNCLFLQTFDLFISVMRYLDVPLDYTQLVIMYWCKRLTHTHLICEKNMFALSCPTFETMLLLRLIHPNVWLPNMWVKWSIQCLHLYCRANDKWCEQSDTPQEEQHITLWTQRHWLIWKLRVILRRRIKEIIFFFSITKITITES